jgi:hypothetical protein
MRQWIVRVFEGRLRRFLVCLTGFKACLDLENDDDDEKIQMMAEESHWRYT